MKVSDLISMWEKNSSGQLTKSDYRVRLPIEDAAKIEALCEMYPKKNVESVITDLISTALSELETEMPYLKGNKVVAEDEEGDPIYEDTGPTPRFLALSQKHLKRLKEQ